MADVPTRALTDEAPVYRRPMREPEWQRRVQQLNLDGAESARARRNWRSTR